MEETLNKLVENWRNEDGTLKQGHPPLEGAGRPRGKSLKEFWRERFAAMSDEEKIDFSQKVDPKLLWLMAEGNPAQTTDVTTNGKDLPTPILGYVPTDNITKEDTKA